MFWIVLAAVAAVLFALAWWSSGRAKPIGRRRDRDTDPAVQRAIQYGDQDMGRSGF